MKKIFYIMFVSLIAFTSIHSQKVFSSQNASATTVLVVPLSITSTLGDLDFGEIILSSVSTKAKLAPKNGKLFIVSGHPNRSVTFTFSSVKMDNSLWVAAFGGTVDKLKFKPKIKLANGTRIKSGDSHTLRLTNGIGQLDVWVGGSIKISAKQKNGNYIGRFTLSVTY